MSSSKTFYLLDGHFIMYRAYFSAIASLRYDAFITAKTKKEYTVGLAIRHFVLWVEKLVATNNALVIAFDLQTPQWRIQLIKNYKQNRPKTPQELNDALKIIKQYLTLRNIQFFESNQYEADDIIASIIEKYNDKYKFKIFSNDLDLCQLISKSTSIYQLKQGLKSTNLITIQNYEKYLPVVPQKLAIYKALAGDSSDNYSGIPGIGNVTAKKICEQITRVDDIYAKNLLISEKHHNLLVEYKEIFLKSYKIAKLKKDYEIDDSKLFAVLQFPKTKIQNLLGIIAPATTKAIINMYEATQKKQFAKMFESE